MITSVRFQGRIIGVSKDARDKQAYRMALQTREQHIRREKANSNICTAQVLLANIAAFYAMYHGPTGLRRIASRIHRLTQILAIGLQSKGIKLDNETYFDTLTLAVSEDEAMQIAERAGEANINLRLDRIASHQTIGVSLDECTSDAEIEALWQVIIGKDGASLSVADIDNQIETGAVESVVPAKLERRTAYMTHPVFNRFHSETDMMRYLKRLENKDISLTHSMIALGSCTMKLNAAAEMIPVTWPEFSKPHPFTPVDQMQGYQKMIQELEHMLEEITGFDAVSMQPNSGAQGEYAGLLAIRKYLDGIGETQRNICLIPTSAHGTESCKCPDDWHESRAGCLRRRRQY
jgi:glycine dehydrogenase